VFRLCLLAAPASLRQIDRRRHQAQGATCRPNRRRIRSHRASGRVHRRRRVCGRAAWVCVQAGFARPRLLQRCAFVAGGHGALWHRNSSDSRFRRKLSGTTGHRLLCSSDSRFRRKLSGTTGYRLLCSSDSRFRRKLSGTTGHRLLCSNGWVGRRPTGSRYELGLYKIFFYFLSCVHESTILSFFRRFRPACVAHTVAILLHGYWAIYAPPRVSPRLLQRRAFDAGGHGALEHRISSDSRFRRKLTGTTGHRLLCSSDSSFRRKLSRTTGHRLLCSSDSRFRRKLSGATGHRLLCSNGRVGRRPTGSGYEQALVSLLK